MPGTSSRTRPRADASWRRSWWRSWLEHLRQHQRVTNADRVVQDAIRNFGATAEPKVTHLIAARPPSQ
ncbi:MFS transporter [Bradyrhizobium sp. USDA 329]|uniref:MFS transporter n=1 Tax=Bradyrhizobium sp. USDA 329 TaxID=3156310 RepID=UPI0035159F1D